MTYLLLNGKKLKPYDYMAFLEGEDANPTEDVNIPVPPEASIPLL